MTDTINTTGRRRIALLMFLRVFLLSLITVVIGVGIAVGVCQNRQDSIPPPVQVEEESTKIIQNDPSDFAQRYALVWMSGNYSALFDMVHSDSQKLTPSSPFNDFYNNFDAATGLTKITVLVNDVTPDIVTFDVRLQTRYYGDFQYGVTLNLIYVDGDFFALWNPTAIHPDLSPGGEFKSYIKRPRRGNIYDRNGFVLATTADIRYVGLDRNIINSRGDREEIEKNLLELGFDSNKINEAFESDLGLNQRVKVGEVTEEMLSVVIEAQRSHPGLIMWIEAHRIHPLESAAAHVVGYTREYTALEIANLNAPGIRPGDRRGTSGLEATMDSVLAGQPGIRLEIAHPNLASVVLFEQGYIESEDVYTTLDSSLLVLAEQLLGVQPGASVLFDLRNNSILALNSSPSFQPSSFEFGVSEEVEMYVSDDGQPLINRATSGLYSAGSTFKIVTAAAGLASSLFSISDQIPCPSIWHGVDPPRRNWEGTQGDLSIARALMRSCNPVFYEIGLTLYENSENALPNMARAFGFGTSVGVIGLVDEDGLVPDAAWKSAARAAPWYPGDAVNLSIGQGDLLITVLQLANAYSALVAGELRNPQLLIYRNPEDTPVQARESLPLSSEILEYLQYGLQLVTSRRGTSGWAFENLGFTDFAGKSGTAEEGEGQTHVLWVGYTPLDNPRFLAAVILENGKEGYSLAAPLVRDLLISAQEE